jgi:hypothetical protein
MFSLGATQGRYPSNNPLDAIPATRVKGPEKYSGGVWPNLDMRSNNVKRHAIQLD